MKVAVAAGRVPFLETAIDGLVAALVAHLSARGIEAEALRLPVSPATVAAWENTAAQALLVELFNVDRLIALDFPASLLRGVATAVWLVEPHAEPENAFLTGSATRALSRAERIFAATPSIRDEIERRTGCRAALLAIPVGSAARDWSPIVAALTG